MFVSDVYCIQLFASPFESIVCRGYSYNRSQISRLSGGPERGAS